MKIGRIGVDGHNFQSLPLIKLSTVQMAHIMPVAFYMLLHGAPFGIWGTSGWQHTYWIQRQVSVCRQQGGGALEKLEGSVG